MAATRPPGTWSRGGNTVVLRTFSKAYGLAGFRVGWGAIPAPHRGGDAQGDKPQQPARTQSDCGPSCLGRSGVYAGNLRQDRCGPNTGVCRLGGRRFDVVPSVTNFLLIRFADEAEAKAAETTLSAQGIVLRRQAGAALPHALRMTIGEDAACHAAIDALCRWKTGGAEMTPSRGRARVGVLVPFTNSNLEPDFALMAPPGVSLHIARMGGYEEDEIPDEGQMQALGASDLDEPLALLMGVKPDVVVYGCTSATLTHGPAFDRDLAARIASVSGAQTVNRRRGLWCTRYGPWGCRPSALRPPYVPAINDMAVRFLADLGVTTVARSEVDAALGNHDQGALEPDAVYDPRPQGRFPRGGGPGLVLYRHAQRRNPGPVRGRLGQTGDKLEPGDDVPTAWRFGGYPSRSPGFGRLLERVSAMSFDKIAAFTLDPPDIPDEALQMGAILLLDTLAVAAGAAGDGARTIGPRSRDPVSTAGQRRGCGHAAL